MAIKTDAQRLRVADDVKKAWNRNSKTIATKIGTQFVREQQRATRGALKIKGKGRIKAIRRIAYRTPDGGFGLLMADFSVPSETQETPTTIKAKSGGFLILPFAKGQRDPLLEKGAEALKSPDVYVRPSRKSGKKILFRKAATADQAAVAETATFLGVPVAKVRGVPIATLVSSVRTKVKLGFLTKAAVFADTYGDAVIDAMLEGL